MTQIYAQLDYVFLLEGVRMEQRPLPWVVVRTQMQFVISCSSPRVISHATEMVTVDAVEIIMWERMVKSMYVA